MPNEKTGCWKPQTKAERIILFLLIFFLLAAVALAAVLTVVLVKKSSKLQVYEYREPPTSPSTTTCTSSKCIESAANLLSKMKLTANPCEDFFEYACGQFLDRAKIGHQGTIGGIADVANKNTAKIREILEKPLEFKDPEYFIMIKTFYGSCMNTTPLKENPFFKQMLNLGGWPVLHGDQWTEKHFDWRNLLYGFRKLGIDTDFLLEIKVVTENASRYILKINQGKLHFPSRQQLARGSNDEDNERYYDYMVKTCLLFGADEERAKSAMRTVLGLEIGIAKNMTSDDEKRPIPEYNRTMTLQELRDFEPALDWVQFLKNYGLPINVTEDLEVLVEGKAYIKFIIGMLFKVNKRVVADYMVWQMAKTAIPLLDPTFFKLYTEYLGYEIDRTKYCADTTTDVMSLGLGALYIQKYFDKKIKLIAGEIVQDITQQFLTNSYEYSWLDAETKLEMQKKLNKMKYTVGYLDNSLNNKKISDYYKKLNFSHDDFYGNVRQANKFKKDKNLAKLLFKPDDLKWVSFTEHSVQVHAQYDPTTNSLEILPGLLTSIVYDLERPRYMNYGSLGYYVGHELMHAFDESGSRYDAGGNVKIWWKPETLRKYEDKVQCMVLQYGNYTDKEANATVNGTLTQDENIADNGGLKTAYKAYQNWVEKNEPEAQLPGLNLTNNQVFWISAANLYCTKVSETTANSDIHAPVRYRINGPLSNSREFATDFKCPKSSPMNPKMKCEVW